MICSKCGAVLDRGKASCPLCGAAAVKGSDSVDGICRFCGKKLKDGETTCPVCGKQAISMTPSKKIVIPIPTEPPKPTIDRTEPAKVVQPPKTYCLNCGKEVPNGTTLCDDCQNKTIVLNRCPKCGAALSAGDVFCMKCGAKVGGDPEPVISSNVCPICGASVSPGDVYCIRCGNQIGGASTGGVCPNCGTPTEPGDAYCMGCGTPLQNEPDISFGFNGVKACRECGFVNDADTYYCQNCGAPV